MNLVGAQIGNYVVQRELGAGGMGTVYVAEHRTLGRKVAVKVLHDEHAADADTVARFFQEAKAAAEVGHENIIEVIDFGDVMVGAWKVVYLMMELLDGESLGKRLRAGPMAPDDVRHVTLQVCSALAACHAKGIIHRDLKPENIHLCARVADPMFVKVLDFGIAKLTGPGHSSTRTRVGTVLGTPAYMSPEQCRGTGEIDARSDVYAAGVVMYEMLTCMLPFGGELGEILQGHLVRTPLPPSAHLASVPPVWDALVLHCLEKDRDARPASMTALAAALGDLEAHARSYAALCEARRAAAPRPMRTAVLPPEERIGWGPIGESPIASAAAPSMVPPTAHPDAPTIHIAPPVGPPRRSPDGTPPPFEPLGAGAGPATPVPFAAPIDPYAPTPTPAPWAIDTAPTSGGFTPARLGVSPWWYLVGIASFAVAFVAAAGILFFRGQGAPRSATGVAADARPDLSIALPVDAAAAAVAVPDAPAPPADAPPPVVDAAARVRVTLISEPPGARITGQDGEQRIDGVAPLTLERAADAPPLAITLTLDGRPPVTRTLAPTHDTEVVVVMPPATATPRAPAPPRPRPPDRDRLLPPEL